MDLMTVESKGYILSNNSSLRSLGFYRGISNNASSDSISKAVLTIASLSLTKPIIPANTDELEHSNVVFLAGKTYDILGMQLQLK